MGSWLARPQRVARYIRRSSRGPAAVGSHDASRHVRGLVGEEKGDQPGDIVRLSRVAEQNAALRSLPLAFPRIRLRLVGGEHRRADRTGTDAIDADSLVSVVDRHGARQSDDAGFRRTVGGAVGAAGKTVLRADVDDHAATGLAQEGDRRPAHVENATQIDVHHRPPVVERGCHDVAGEGPDARDVDGSVETTQLPGGGLNRRLDLVPGADIGRSHHPNMRGIAQLAHLRVKRVGLPVHPGDMTALGREPRTGRRTNPGCSPGDQHPLPLQPGHRLVMIGQYCPAHPN